MLGAADKTKLNNVASGATANSTDAQLRDRSTHTGFQLINTITDLQTILDSKEPTILILPISKGGTGSNIRNFVDLISNETIAGIKSFSGGGINLTNAANNLITYFNVGLDAPTFTTRSLGTKVVLRSGLSSTATEYALGTANLTLWQSIPVANSNYFFKWYAGIAEIASLRGDGLLSLQKLTVASIDAWAVATLQNTWANSTSPQAICAYRKLPDGTVEIKGYVTKSTTPTVGETIFNLPTGFRPLETRIFATMSNNLIGRVDVLSNGNVIFAVGSNVWFSLQTIRFVAEQ